MSIEFHCSKCSKLVRAPRSAGGKRGKCPYCKESVYIPTPPEEIEDIPLASISEADLARERRLQDEARQLTAAIDREDSGKYDTGEPPTVGGDSAVALPRDFDADVPTLVNEYLSAMVESDMGRADVATRQLKKHSAQAKVHVQRLMADETSPSDLGNVPTAVYKGFLRSLLDLL